MDEDEVIELLNDIWGQIERDKYEDDNGFEYVEMRDINYWFKYYIKSVKEEGLK